MASELIKPTVPLIPGHIKLPPLDQVEIKMIIPPLLVFRVDSPDAQDTIVENLQDGLAITIGQIPFIAGTVIPDNAERETVQVEIGEEAGVWLHVRELPELDYEALERRWFAPAAFSVVQLMPEPREHNWNRSPVLTIQATFITGGLIIAFNAHHSAMDGRGMSVFAKTWAKNVGAVAEGRTEATLNEESLDRSKIFGNGSCGMQLSEFPHYRVAPRFRGARTRELMGAAIAGELSPQALQVLKGLHLSYWMIPNSSMQAMMEAAQPPTPNAPVLTEGTILSALIWRHITRARQLSSHGVESTSLLNVVNVCRRLDPPLPFEYLGNALTHAKATAKTVDVESKLSLYELARLVNDSIEWWTSERIWGFIGALDSTPKVAKVEPAIDNFLGPDVEITNSGSFAEMMHISWGPDMGKVICMRFPYIPLFDGWANIIPVGENSPKELLIALDKKTMSRFREDPEWNAFAKFYE